MLYIMCVKKPIKDRFDDSIFGVFTALTLILLLGDCTMRKIAFFLQNLNWFLKSICSYVSYCHHFGQTLLTYRVLLSIEKKKYTLKITEPFPTKFKTFIKSYSPYFIFSSERFRDLNTPMLQYTFVSASKPSEFYEISYSSYTWYNGMLHHLLFCIFW